MFKPRVVTKIYFQSLIAQLDQQLVGNSIVSVQGKVKKKKKKTDSGKG